MRERNEVVGVPLEEQPPLGACYRDPSRLRLVAVLQQFANFYLGGTGDLVVVIALAAVLLVRPRGLLGKVA